MKKGSSPKKKWSSPRSLSAKQWLRSTINWETTLELLLVISMSSTYTTSKVVWSWVFLWNKDWSNISVINPNKWRAHCNLHTKWAVLGETNLQAIQWTLLVMIHWKKTLLTSACLVSHPWVRAIVSIGIIVTSLTTGLKFSLKSNQTWW